MNGRVEPERVGVLPTYRCTTFIRSEKGSANKTKRDPSLRLPRGSTYRTFKSTLDCKDFREDMRNETTWVQDKDIPLYRQAYRR